MIMAQKHLHDLLKEDQEPFQLKNYIADRRWQLKTTSSKPHLQFKKRNQLFPSEISNFPGKFCKNVCFLSSHNSLDLRKSNSPLFEFQSPSKSPCKSPNAIFPLIPAKTKALLLESALRIHKQRIQNTQSKSLDFGVFGSFFKRLTNRNRARKRETESDGIMVSVKDKLLVEAKSASETSFCETGFASCSDHFQDPEEIDQFLAPVRNEIASGSCESDFCQSPFRFVLQQSPSSGHCTPEFSSPAASPVHSKNEEKTSYAVEDEEEEKEQCSPVSVLDPPFEDDDGGEEEDENEEVYEMECSYAVVQRANQHLLNKLCRFEKLAELDPIELEKRMLEDDQDNDGDDNFDEKECGSEDSLFVREVMSNSTLCSQHQFPNHMKKLVSDLIAERNGVENTEEVVKRICKTLEEWKEVESNTIDMMVEQEFKKDIDWSKKSQQTIQETEIAINIERSIFINLVEELVIELVC